MEFYSAALFNENTAYTGVALPIKGGSSWGNSDKSKSSSRFIGHGGGRGPVFHSSVQNPYTVNILTVSSSGDQFACSGVVYFYHHASPAIMDLHTLCYFDGAMWHGVQIRLEFGRAKYGHAVTGYHKGQFLNGSLTNGVSTTTNYSLDYALALEFVRRMERKDISIIDQLDQMFSLTYSSIRGKWMSQHAYPFSIQESWKSPQCPFLGDYEMVSEFGFAGLSTAMRLGLAMATEDMVQNLPRSDINIIATAMDIAKVIQGDVNAISSLSDAWLSYRYAYTTTKLDIRSMKTYLNRLGSLSTSNSFKAYGRYTDSSGTFNCQAEFSYTTDDISKVKEMAREASRQLSLVNTWDLIPYSFIVDWILPIEDICRCIDTASEIAELKPTTIWYSYHCLSDRGDGVFEETYIRFPKTSSFVTTPLTLFNQSNGETTNRVKTFRTIDAISLVIGR